MNGMEINEPNTHYVGSDTSFTAPALSAHNGRLIIAWVGEDGGHHLNVMASNDGKTWDESTKRTIWTDFSNAGPALTSYQGRLYLTYTGTDSHIYLINSVDGVYFDATTRIKLSQTATGSPATTARDTQNGDPQFVLAWTGGWNRINYEECEGTRFEDLNTPTPGFVYLTSPSGPALASNSFEIALLYRGFAGNGLAMLGAGEGTIDLDTHQTVFLDTSGFRPALVLGNNSPAWVAWTGQDGDQSLNFAALGAMRTG
jgi:hypothetical protein